jgi:hypothetical protein
VYIWSFLLASLPYTFHLHHLQIIHQIPSDHSNSNMPGERIPGDMPLAIEVIVPGDGLLRGSHIVRLSNATIQDPDALTAVLSRPNFLVVDHPSHPEVNASIRNDCMSYLFNRMNASQTASGRATERPQTDTPSTDQGSAAGNEPSNASTNTATKK